VVDNDSLRAFITRHKFSTTCTFSDTFFNFFGKGCPAFLRIEASSNIIIVSIICFRHTKEMIRKLESAGLGYHVSADETEDKLGMMLQ
jgi:hypothetical protein